MNSNGLQPVNESVNNKKHYIELIRAISALAVVLLHVVMALPANYSSIEIGVSNYAVLNACYMFVKWPVPCFIMISGSLLLNPERKMSGKKIGKYISRIVAVLLTFGIAFSMMELVFSSKSISIMIFLKALLNTLEGESWSHMWYIYMLIGLYLATIPLRYIIDKMDLRALEIMVVILITGNFLIPSINTLFALSLETYMVVGEYVTYYILGYYLSITGRRLSKIAIPALVISIGVMCVVEASTILKTTESFALFHQTKNILTLTSAASVFVLCKEWAERNNWKEGSAIKLICANSFAIYLIHPFWANILYKVLGFTPISMPIYIGIPALFVIIFALSLLSSMVLRTIPLVKKML